ncbi:MAG: hypothetical protein AB7D05_00405 [Mangrovibacterium sp.]
MKIYNQLLSSVISVVFLSMILFACDDDHETEVLDRFFLEGGITLSSAKDSAELKVNNQFSNFLYIYDIQNKKDTTFLSPFNITMSQKSYVGSWYKIVKQMDGWKIESLKVYADENTTGMLRDLIITVERIDANTVQTVVFRQEAGSVN